MADDKTAKNENLVIEDDPEAKTKEYRIPDVAPDLQIRGTEVTLHPAGYIPPSKSMTFSTPSEKEEEALLHAPSFSNDPLRFLKEISLHVSGSGWRAYDNFIGQPILYPGFTGNVKAKVLSAKILKDRIQNLAEQRINTEDVEGSFGPIGHRKHDKLKERRYKEIVAGLEAVSDRLLDNMMVKFESKTFLRGGAYLATQLTLRAYHQGIHVSSEEVLRLRKVAKVAAQKKQSIVFLPCHRSHVDYVSLQIICYRLGLTLPTVVAGDNLNIPVLGTFLQKCGAMWIRRSFGDDVLYTTLVQTYIDTLLQNGFNLECFIEGGRSRTGKLLPPKFGILSFILDSLLSSRVDDCVICPVSTQYDKVIETSGYVDELLGRPKKKENFYDFVTGGSSVLSLRFGRVDVRFHEPWSLRGFITDQLTKVSLTLSTPIDQLTPAVLTNQSSRSVTLRHKLLRTLGYKVLGDINMVSVVMPTALIGTILLTLRGRGVGKQELERRVNWLTDRVWAKGGRVAHFGTSPMSEIIARGLDVLGKELVGEHKGLAESTYYAADRFQLSFYRNMTIHLFISEALVSTAMYTRIKLGGEPEIQDIEYVALRERVLFLSSLFRGEFIFPGNGLETNLENTLMGLERDEVINLTRDVSGAITKVGLSKKERMAGRENFDFYCFLIWPFIESSWLAAVSIMGMTPPVPNQESDDDVWIALSKAQDSAQLLGKTLYYQGDLSYFESVNKETLKNCYSRFTEESILTIRKFHDPTVKGPNKIVFRLRIADTWQAPRDQESGHLMACGRLWDFIEKISACRREGKDRREGDAVSKRVLRLADELGGKLWKAARGGNVGEVEKVAGRGEKVKRQGRRRRSLEKAKL